MKTYNSSDENTEYPFISVIVPAYNDLERIKLCVDNLNSLQYPRACYEVIIVDNGSTDGTYELLQEILIQKSNFYLLQCTKPGSYSARNYGLKKIKGEFVAFTDSDCIVSNTWLFEHLNEWQKNKGDTIVAGKVDFFSDDSKHTEQSALDFENMFSMKQDQNAENGKCITANLFCSSALLIMHDGFNDALKSGGDVEFCQRVVKEGGKVVYCDAALVSHPSRNVKELIVKRKRVVGGTWDSELASATISRKAKFCLKLVLMFVGRSKKTLLQSSFPLRRKIGLIWLLFLIFVTSLVEFARLQMGKQTNRT